MPRPARCRGDRRRRRARARRNPARGDALLGAIDAPFSGKTKGGDMDQEVAGKGSGDVLRRRLRTAATELRGHGERGGKKRSGHVPEMRRLTLLVTAQTVRSGMAGRRRERARRRRHVAEGTATTASIRESPHRFLRSRWRGGHGGDDAPLRSTARAPERRRGSVVGGGDGKQKLWRDLGLGFQGEEQLRGREGSKGRLGASYPRRGAWHGEGVRRGRGRRARSLQRRATARRRWNICR